jgi:hypothetical protein
VCCLVIWLGGFPSIQCWKAEASGRWLVAPIGLACPNGEEWFLAQVLGTGTRHWTRAVPASAEYSFSFFRIHVPSLLSAYLDSQLSFFILSLLLSKWWAFCLPAPLFHHNGLQVIHL